jgi:hypothetical protein
MKKLLHNIRNRPEHKRDQIVWIVAAASVGLLLIIWAIVGNGRKTTVDDSFVENFSAGLEEGKNTFDQNPLEP